MTMPFRNLVVPIDGSPTAARAVAYAIEIAGPETNVHFCSVVDVAGFALAGGMGTVIDLAPIMDDFENVAQLATNDAVATARKRGVIADGTVLRGAVVPAIEEFVRDGSCDAVVIGTHARTGLSRVIAGSVTESLLQSSHVPVFVTHIEDDTALRGPITVAVDSSGAARAAVAVAIRIASARKDSLSIVSVVEPGGDGYEAECVLAEMAEVVRTADIDFELVTLRGHAAATIVDSARRRASAMIVIGTHGRSTLGRTFFGSVAASVIERARIPVVVIRPVLAHSQSR